VTRRRWFVATALIIGAVGAGLVVVQRRSKPLDTTDRRTCSEAIEEFFTTEKAIDDKVHQQERQLPADWGRVEIAYRGDAMWTFTDDGTGVALGSRADGVFDAGEDINGYRADVIRFDPAVPEGRPRRRERRVIVGPSAWVEDAQSPDRLACRAWSFSYSTLGAEPYLDRFRNPDRPDPKAPNISPGMTVVAKAINTETVDGVTMTTYEQHPVERYEQIRTRFTLDADKQLRWAEAVDTTTGKVLYTRTARPAPDHPQIHDPTGEPIISMNP
jgi:hypothetical protein